MEKKNILIIDDEMDYSETMRFYLKAKGFNVRCAASGQAGIEQARRERPDMVFLDFMMSGMDGVETLKRLREACPGLPVIMVTSYASDELVREARLLGVAGIFPKADDFSEAARLINGVLGEKG